MIVFLPGGYNCDIKRVLTYDEFETHFYTKKELRKVKLEQIDEGTL